jgi:hypothetical protein
MEETNIIMAEETTHLTNKPSEGIHQDNSYIDQPKGSPRFALNATVESEEGNLGFRTVEEGCQSCDDFPTGYTPVGREYMGNGKTAIFLVKDDGTGSEIGILDIDCVYTTHVNDSTQNDKLGFSVINQIDATYRLRRGCERTIYFVQKSKPPRYYNFDGAEDFKTGSLWSPEKFKLFKTSGSVPNFGTIEILETGAIPPGSYNFSLQYLDEDLNPTQWISTTDTIIIYNDNPDVKPFSEVRGSTNEINFYQDFGVTNKAIRLNLSNLNTEFPFYRIAVIEANNGSGLVSRVIYSQEISTSVPVYTYTGQNAFTLGTETEVLAFSGIIESAENIEQIENRLIIGKTKGKQVNWCELQKYASRITADVVTEETILNNLATPNNPKRAQLHGEKLGYMPGEIYSFGICYIFSDGYVSPSFHIPGRATEFSSSMSKENNLTDVFYTDNTCGTSDYWGADSQGDSLLGENVRHHRFPLRSELGIPLYTRTAGSLDGVESIYNTLYVDIGNDVLGSTLTQEVEFEISYTIDGTPSTDTFFVNNIDPGGVANFIIVSSVGVIVYTGVQEVENGVPGAIYSGLTYTSRIETSTSTTQDAEYRSDMLGIQFSNIDIPGVEAIGTDESIVGYYIVRQDRTEDNKTILDNGILAPLIIEKTKAGNADKFVAHGHLSPNTTRIKTDVVALIHPEFKFNDREYRNTTEFYKEGEFTIDSQNFSNLLIQDVMPGTSYDSSVNKRRERDSDGFTLHNYIRNSNVSYAPSFGLFADQANIKEVFYLDTLFSKTVDDVNAERKEIFNLSADNKIGILQTVAAFDTADVTGKFPYVVMKRNLSSPYSGFRVVPYYKEHTNPQTFAQPIGNTSNPIYNGDSYIGSMKYWSSMFYDIRLRERRTKSGLLNFVLGALLLIISAILLIPSGGTSAGLAVTGLGLMAVGFAVTQITAGLKKEQLARVYGELYDLGLKDTVEDDDTAPIFSPNPGDDEVQWFFDMVSNFWIETSVNMNWRAGSTTGITDFLNSPEGYSQSVSNSYSTEKVTVLDSEADGGRNYTGFATGELYQVNKDYQRRDRQKEYFHLGIEYDCCSDCVEDFPGRNHWSEQSFQEELTDNYRVFLPNNYRDIEGETGVIFNIFRIQNNLYIHTEEALWHLPQNIQERITGEVVSFIGTGEFFSIPPRKILDDDTGHSAGVQHKWGSVKTPHGVYFICESQKTVYRFDGSKLEPISSKGLFNHFKGGISLQVDNSYYSVNRKDYPFRDNPSNIYGSGFLATYDSRKERIIFTKKDLEYTEALITGSTDYELCTSNNELVVFDNFQQTITTQEGLGWNFAGIVNADHYEVLIDDTELVFQSYFSLNNSFGILMINFVGSISSISVKLKRFGAPDHNIKAYLYDDFNVLQQTSTTIKAANTLTEIWEWVKFEFDGVTTYNETLYFRVVIEDIVLSGNLNRIESASDSVAADPSYLLTLSQDFGPTYATVPGESLQMLLEAGDLGACKMKFQRETTITSQIETEVIIANDADVIIHLDMSGSFDATGRDTLRTTALAWFDATPTTLPNWTGNMYFIEHTDTNLSEQYLLALGWARTYTHLFSRVTGVNDTGDFTGTVVSSGLSDNLILVSFVNEAGLYHASSVSDPIPAFKAQFSTDRGIFLSDHATLLGLGGSFSGLVYPIVFTNAAPGSLQAITTAYLQSCLAAIKGSSYTTGEVAIINAEPNLFASNWSTIMDSLTGVNPYGPTALEDYGWYGIWNRGWNGTGDVMTPAQFLGDMDSFLQGQTSTEITNADIPFVECMFIDGTTIANPTSNNASWTMSYSLKKDSWTSWHSYFPNIYIHTPDNFYSWIHGNTGIWKHNIKGFYQNYYGVQHPFIVEYVSMKSPLITGIWDYIRLITEARKYDSATGQYKEERFTTFTKAIFYNSRQCSGEVALRVKDSQASPEDYLEQQVIDPGNDIVIIDKNEKDWTINDLRDIRIDYDNTIWDSSLGSVQSEYFIDKVLNTSTLDVNKSVYELESFRDKYLVIRLIFDTFDDVKLTVNYSVENEINSYR